MRGNNKPFTDMLKEGCCSLSLWKISISASAGIAPKSNDLERCKNVVDGERRGVSLLMEATKHCVTPRVPDRSCWSALAVAHWVSKGSSSGYSGQEEKVPAHCCEIAGIGM